MRFGLFYQAPESAGRSHAERFAEMFDLIAYGESLGFDVAWLAEIHSAPRSRSCRLPDVGARDRAAHETHPDVRP